MKTMDQGGPELDGSWTHSFEEDEAEVLVYRPTDAFAFPPARRGRESIVFAAGGEITALSPGPDDRSRAAGRWRALGMNRYGVGGTADAPAQVLEIVEAGPRILKLRKL